MISLIQSTDLIMYFTFPILYLGPETVMPLASILAAILGVILMLWRYIWGFVKKAFRRIIGKKPEVGATDPSQSDSDGDISGEIAH